MIRNLSHLLFFSKREISCEVSTFGGLLFSRRTLLSGFVMNTCTFEGSLFSVLDSIFNNYSSRPDGLLTQGP